MSDHQEPAELSAQKRALFAIRDLKARLEAIERARTEPIAIVGMACRLPGASSVDEYWELLRNGVDAIRPVPEDRWDIDAFYDPDPDAPGKMYTREGGFLEQIDQFDAPLLRDLAARGGQHGPAAAAAAGSVAGRRWSTPGMPPGRLRRLEDRRVRRHRHDRLHRSSPSHNPDSNAHRRLHRHGRRAVSVAAGRLSYVLGLHGPSLAVDTACSSSLVACTWRVQSLRSGECRMALAGGVNVILLAATRRSYLSKARMLSPDGRCKTFDAAADGYVRGEGCGIVVLKRLSDAERDGDRMLAVIRGSAVNQDGRSSGLTAPNGPAQESGDPPRPAPMPGSSRAQVDYVEAHGTGTPLGDPIEVRRARRGARARTRARNRLLDRLGQDEHRPPRGRGRRRRPDQGRAGAAARRDPAASCTSPTPNPHIPLGRPAGHHGERADGLAGRVARCRWPASRASASAARTRT